MASLSEDIDAIVRSLVEILRNKGQTLQAQILANSNVDIREQSYDNWKGGTYGYSLNLQVPIEPYAKIHDSLNTIEEELLQELTVLTRAYVNEYLESLFITPKLIKHSRPIDDKSRLNIDTIRFWKTGYFRLFISHVSSIKAKAAQLQKDLDSYGISAFVAHEDIEPTKEWQDEIELALSSMDALVALRNKCQNAPCLGTGMNGIHTRGIKGGQEGPLFL